MSQSTNGQKYNTEWGGGQVERRTYTKEKLRSLESSQAEMLSLLPINREAGYWILTREQTGKAKNASF